MGGRKKSTPLLALLGIFFLFAFSLPARAEMIIAVPDFKVSGCMPWLGGAVAEQVRTRLTGRGPWTLLEAAQIASVGKEHRLALSGLADDKKAVSAGKLLGAQYLIVGTVNSTGSGFTLDARLVDVATAVVYSGFQAACYEGEEGLPEAAANLADDIAMELGGPEVSEASEATEASEPSETPK